MAHELAAIGRRFDPWGFACRYGVEKPDPAIFRALCDEARVTPEAVFFIDDSPEHVAAAQMLEQITPDHPLVRQLRVELENAAPRSRHAQTCWTPAAPKSQSG